MKNLNKILTILAVGALFLSSCSMDVKPTTSIAVDPETEPLFSDVNDLVKFENGLYQSFRSVQYGAYTMPLEVMCDGFNAATGFGNNLGPIHRMDNSYTSSDQDTQTFWAGHYAAIKNYNIFIDALDKYEPESNQGAFYKMLGEAEAKFFRAYSYLSLIRVFGKAYNPSTASSDLGVLLVLHFDQTAEPARATVQQVYDQIKADLDDAYALLNNVGATVSELGTGHVTVEAVDALYARYYIDTKQYEKAAEKAAGLVDGGAFELSSDDDMMQAEWLNDNGTEPIMQLYASLSENGTGINDYYTQLSYNANYVSVNGTGYYFQPYFLPSGKLINLYEDNDLRRTNWFMSRYTTGNSCPLLRLSSLQYCTVEVFTKYYGNPALTSSYPNARQAAKPFLIGEQYLIAAEAYLAAGDATNAKKYLNDLQAARGATETEATAENIQNEWFKETVGEGLRMSCIKRWGTGFSGRVQQARNNGEALTGDIYVGKNFPASDYHWQWAIPAYEMKVNANIVQNPGYGAE